MIIEKLIEITSKLLPLYKTKCTHDKISPEVESAYCPDCGAEVFFDENKVATGVAHTCWNCGRALQYPVSIIIGKTRVLLKKGAKLMSHNISADYDMDTVVGEVVQNPNNPNLWGIKNVGRDNWTYIRADGQQIPVAAGKSAAIAKDAKISFGQLIGEFK